MRDILEDAEGAAERGDVGPGKSNREHDKQKFPKRFYKAATVGERDEGFAILLDGRPIKTPGRKLLALPGEASAQLIADEWEAVKTEINPLKMPCTRLANTAVDGVANETQAVLEDVIRFAGSDLLCYRANTPVGLVEKQREHWDAILDWYASKLNAHFEICEGITHIVQPREAIAAYGARLKMHGDPFKLASIHTFTSISGSALIALALTEDQLTAEQAWEVAHVDEDWNISQWGEDFDAQDRRAQRWLDFSSAFSFLKSL